MNLGIVCGSFHRDEVERMLEFAKDEAVSKNWLVHDIVWVPGSMEAPLALDRMLQREEIHGAIVLGIIERGETDQLCLVQWVCCALFAILLLTWSLNAPLLAHGPSHHAR